MVGAQRDLVSGIPSPRSNRLHVVTGDTPTAFATVEEQTWPILYPPVIRSVYLIATNPSLPLWITP
jgi:hypothetical protein